MKNLVGHSGCSLRIENDKVVKTSPDINYNKRLYDQFLKQDKFYSNKIFTPKIYKSYYDDDGLFTFVMQYIRGQSFNYHLIKKPFAESLILLEILLDYIKSNLLNSDDFISNDVILKKLNHISKKEKIDDVILNFLIQKIPILKIKKGYCHGDFTFENILISSNKIYLIDFLDSYVQSPLQDISKLYQDFYSLWSFRNMNASSLVNIRLIKMESMTREFLSLSKGDKLAIDVLCVMNLLRIFPYSNNLQLKLNLTKNINYIIKKWK